ncbi:MAG: hypothetical protein WDN49_03835 [Acetobacteraceae bacterium]
MTIAARDHAELAAETAEHDDGQHDRGFDEGEAFRADEGLPRGEEAPAKPPNIAPMEKAVSLVTVDVDAEAAAGDLVLAQRLPGAAQGQAAQAQGGPSWSARRGRG